MSVRFLSSRRPVVTVMAQADTLSQLSENFAISASLARLPYPSLFLCGGKLCARHRRAAPLLSDSLFCASLNRMSCPPRHSRFCARRGCWSTPHVRKGVRKNESHFGQGRQAPRLERYPDAEGATGTGAHSRRIRGGALRMEEGIVRRVRPAIFRVLPITEAEAAHVLLYDGKSAGKVVLHVAG